MCSAAQGNVVRCCELGSGMAPSWWCFVAREFLPLQVSDCTLWRRLLRSFTDSKTLGGVLVDPGKSENDAISTIVLDTSIEWCLTLKKVQVRLDRLKAGYGWNLLKKLC